VLITAILGLILIASPQGFAIKVVDEQTGRGVPLIELKTTDSARYWTDNAGLVAFDEPGLMNTEVYFHVKGHGYEYPQDGFKYRGVRLKPRPGGEATIKVKRINIAERLYRITGGGLYRDSLILGKSTPLKNPAISGLVFGQDSVINGICNGTFYWFWGDTNKPGYPLGNFYVPGATAKLPAEGGLDPELGVDLTYFVDKDGFAKPTAKLPGEGPTWIFGVAVLKGEDGREHMMGSYVKVRGFLEVYEHGAVEFDETKKEWVKRAVWPEKLAMYPGGQTVLVQEGGESFIVLQRDMPNLRVRAKIESYLDIKQYEGWSPFKPGTKDELDRDPSGKLVLGWKQNTPPIDFEAQERLLKSGKLSPQEAPIKLRDLQTGKPIRPHGTTMMWNEYRKKWSMIILEMGGASSLLGEIWYAESDKIEGPWTDAVKVVTHDKYSFYNPRLHPYFAKDKGRVLFFEGTYTTLFSGNIDPTPRYDYNQIMYRLDLDDPRLKLKKSVR
jgi:hypothetical protein